MVCLRSLVYSTKLGSKKNSSFSRSKTILNVFLYFSVQGVELTAIMNCTEKAQMKFHVLICGKRQSFIESVRFGKVSSLKLY